MADLVSKISQKIIAARKKRLAKRERNIKKLTELKPGKVTTQPLQGRQKPAPDKQPKHKREF